MRGFIGEVFPFGIRLIFVFIFAFIFISGCSKGVEPGFKNPREYEWEVIRSNWGYFKAIWGSSASDVYAVGSVVEIEASMYHFDGRRWEPVRSFLDVFKYVPLRDIYGFGSDDIFVVGDKKVIHFNGKFWVDKTPDTGASFLSVWGSRSDDVWVVDYNGLYHYDGSKWEKDTTIGSGYYFNFYSNLAGVDSDEVYLFGSREKFGIPNILFKFDGKRWSVVDSSIHAYKIRVIDKTLYAVGWGVWVFKDGKWLERLYGCGFLYDIWGTDKSNIWVVGLSAIYHYNGRDWVRFDPLDFGLEGVWEFTCVWGTKEGVFIGGRWYSGAEIPEYQTVILHGK